MNPKVLIDENALQKRVKELGREITNSFPEDFVLISVLKGAMVFTADLLRHIERRVFLDFVGLKSYEGMQKVEHTFTYFPSVSIEGKDVLVVDDIFDTGESLAIILSELKKSSPKTLKTCVLLKKEKSRKVDFEPDFVGFSIPDVFVVGYGLDYMENFRGLKYVGYIGEE